MKKWGIIVLLWLIVFSMTAYGDMIEHPNYYRGRIVSVTDLSSNDQGSQLQQKAEVVLTTGPYKGQTVTIQRTYVEDHFYLNIYLRKGMDLVLSGTELDGQLQEVYVSEVGRDRGLLYLVGIFLFLLLWIGKKQGVKTIITLIFTGIIIFKLMLPLLLEGHDPIVVTVGSALVMIIFILVTIGGFNAKSIAAILGTGVGVVVSGLLALWVGQISHLTGFSSQEAQMLFYMDQPIDVRGLLFSGIIIGSLGAITDVGMSVASAAAEIREANPRIRAGSLTMAAMNVGRDIMGTMSNTLLLAYVGGATPLLLLLLGYETHWLKIMNLDLIATEVVRGLAGSIGLIISIPITAVLSGFMMGRKG